MPRVTAKRPTFPKKVLFGGKLIAKVPAVVTVEPLPDDRESLDYDIELELDVIGGRMQCVRLCAVQRDGGPPVTTENLRRVPVGQIITLASLDLRLVSECVPDPANPGSFVPAADSWTPPPADFAEAGMTDEALEQAARVYRMALATGARPFGVLEREFNLPRAKASRWITTARRRGILGDDDAG